MKSPYRPLALAAAAVAIFAVMFVAAGLAGWGPPASNEQAIGEVSRWCERVSGGLLREPVNTLGNLGFVLTGLVMFWMLGRDVDLRRERVNSFVGPTPVALLYASAAVFLGPGSMVMHGSHTRFGAWIDNVSMVAFILVPWLLNLSALGRWRHRTLLVVYATLLLVYAAGYWFIGPDLGIGLDLFGVSIALWLISESLHRWGHLRWMAPVSGLLGFAIAAVFGITPAEMIGSPGDHWWVILFWVPAAVGRHRPDGRRRYFPWFWMGVVSFFSAYAIWLTGTAEDPRCEPDSLVQPHAVWHLLSAVATLSFFLFLRTEHSAGSRRPGMAG